MRKLTKSQLDAMNAPTLSTNSAEQQAEEDTVMRRPSGKSIWELGTEEIADEWERFNKEIDT